MGTVFAVGHQVIPGLSRRRKDGIRVLNVCSDHKKIALFQELLNTLCIPDSQVFNSILKRGSSGQIKLISERSRA